MSENKPIIGKIVINGLLECATGLHIGASQETLQIGGLDSPVVRDPITRQPYIPGSAFRGKLRSILERILNMDPNSGVTFNRDAGMGVHRHECSNPSCKVCRLFGATAGDKEEHNLPARLAVRDIRLTDKGLAKLKEIDTGLLYTELKFENALDRVTAAANPRQIERVPAGAEFAFEMVYTVETSDKNIVLEDLKNIFMLLGIVQDDSLGGHGSRGYGKINIRFEGKPAVAARKVAYYGVAKDERSKFEKTIEADHIDAIQAELEELLNFILEAEA